MAGSTEDKWSTKNWRGGKDRPVKARTLKMSEQFKYFLEDLNLFWRMESEPG